MYPTWSFFPIARTRSEQHQPNFFNSVVTGLVDAPLDFVPPASRHNPRLRATELILMANQREDAVLFGGYAQPAVEGVKDLGRQYDGQLIGDDPIGSVAGSAEP
jgi:hypothetical protein